MTFNFAQIFCSDKTSARKTERQHGRRLRIERLEERELLSITPPGQYTDLSAPPLVIESSICNGCAAYDPKHVHPVAPGYSEAPTVAESPFALDQTFLLHSGDTSWEKIYLDFTGFTLTPQSAWSQFVPDGKSSIDAPAFSDDLEKIQYIWQRVAEDYLPFQVDVTTDASVVDSNGIVNGIRVVIGGGTASDWFKSPAGGMAYVDVFADFSWFDSDAGYNVCWVFAGNLGFGEKSIAEVISHEVGHTFGLGHDGQGFDEYYSGANGWAPIMGSGYYQSLVQWSNGEYSGATNQQDDLVIISTKTPYRQDDHAGSIAEIGPNDVLIFIDGILDTMTGIIERNTDIDLFRFEFGGEALVNFNITPGTRDTNLDILTKILDSTGTEIAISDPQNTLSAFFTDLQLEAGIYYLRIEGTGKSGVYSDYGSLGFYTITGSANVSLPDPEMSNGGTGPANLRSIQTAQTALSLQWNKNEGATEYILQRKGPGGTDFVTIYTGADAKFIDQGLIPDTTYEYRVRAADSAFSDIVSLMTAANYINGNYVTDTPIILGVKTEASGRTTITWTNLGPDYAYTVYKVGRIVASNHTGNSFVDNDPLAIAEYAVRAFSRETQRSSTAATTVVWNTVKPVEFTGYEIVETGVKLLWDIQPDTTYRILRLGHILASNLTAETMTTDGWIDTNPRPNNAYVLVATYQEYDATLGRSVTRRTYSNGFSVGWIPNHLTATNAFWAEYGLNGIEDELFLGV